MANPPDDLARTLADRYRIERELGAGGMATVYLAHDLKHDRQVALKVLRPELAAAIGAERFLAEIRTTANLQHPHILPLHDSGTANGTVFYVMPFVDGETLRSRLTRETQLPLEDAITIAREVADALTHAHTRGVIHRDIKPENILLQDGHALVADFGIALAAARTGGARMTETGMSLGTPTYMSPEQAMGERVMDARTDVYALGAVVYEMLTGEPPFTGPTAQAIVAMVMTERPSPPSVVRDTVPEHVDYAVLRALAKLPADRWPTAAAFAAALAGTGGRAILHRSSPPRMNWTLAAIAGTAVLVAAWSWIGRTPKAGGGEPIRLAIDPPEHWSFSPEIAPAVSPDGRRVVFQADSGPTSRLFVRRLDAFELVTLPGVDGAFDFFFSPDGRWIGFVVGQKLKRIASDGTAPPEDIAAVTEFAYATWADDGSLVYAPDLNTGLFRIPAEGGNPQPLFVPDSSAGEIGVGFPEMLPGSRAVIYGDLTRTGWKLVARSLDNGPPVTLVDGAIKARYLDSGHLIYTKGGQLYLIAFDARRLATSGTPRAIEREAAASLLAGGKFAVYNASRTGTVAFLSSEEAMVRPSLVLVSRTGTVTALREGNGQRPRFERRTGGIIAEDSAQLWSYDLATGGTRSRLTSGGPRFNPVPSPDGSLIALSSYEIGPANLVVMPAAGGAARRLTRSANRQYVGSWCPDGKCLVYSEADPKTGADIWIRNLDLAADQPGTPLVRTEFDEYHPRLSPSGTLLAYTSEQSGRAEVYVRGLEAGSSSERISTDGGSQPVWRADGRELYYRLGNQLMVVAVNPVLARRFAVPRPLVALPPSVDDRQFPFTYDAAPNGSQFVVATTPARIRPLRLHVVVNARD